MLDHNSVITDATKGIVKELAHLRGVSLTRVYEQLGNQCVYPKTKELIADIAILNKDGARLIKADLMAFFNEILGEDAGEVDIAEIHRESSEVIQTLLEDKPIPDKLRELRDLAAVAEKAITQLETGDLSKPQVRQIYQDSQKHFTNGRRAS